MRRGALWNDERIARLKELCEAGLSASEIAAAFGDVSRSAVTGKAWRCGFTLYGNPQVPKPHVPIKFKAVKKKKPKPPPDPEEIVEDDPPPKPKKIRPRHDIVRTKAEYQQMLAEAVRNTVKMNDD